MESPSTINIQLEWTPNPNTLKYVVQRRLVPSGAVNFTESEQADVRSPLAKKLFSVRGVTAVMLGSNFVTITKGSDGDWDELNDSVMRILEEHLGSNQPVLLGTPKPESSSFSEVEQRIQDILEREIRPGVMMDGGDITLDRYEDGIVFLNMRGSCSGCPSSTATLKMGIETRLREVIPEVVEVVPV
jgi:Fe-S cluster biogenesis protein NfuA